MTKLVDGLVRDGLALREADPDDARAVRVRATATGARTLRRGRAKRLETLRAHARDPLPRRPRRPRARASTCSSACWATARRARRRATRASARATRADPRRDRRPRAPGPLASRPRSCRRPRDGGARRRWPWRRGARRAARIPHSTMYTISCGAFPCALNGVPASVPQTGRTPERTAVRSDFFESSSIGRAFSTAYVGDPVRVIEDPADRTDRRRAERASRHHLARRRRRELVAVLDRVHAGEDRRADPVRADRVRRDRQVPLVRLAHAGLELLGGERAERRRDARREDAAGRDQLDRGRARADLLADRGADGIGRRPPPGRTRCCGRGRR